jgi:hypothetical protein
MYVALGGVLALFHREIKPMKRYNISSRVLAWDHKWLWVVSHFIGEKPSDLSKLRPIYASCLSKYVFKVGRKTITPESVIRDCGLLPARPSTDPGIDSGTCSGLDTPVNNSLPMGGIEGAAEVEDLLAKDIQRAMNNETPSAMSEKDGYWTWERIEDERKRGLRLAQHMIGLDGLADEFRDGDEEGLVKAGHFFGGW